MMTYLSKFSDLMSDNNSCFLEIYNSDSVLNFTNTLVISE